MKRLQWLVLSLLFLLQGPAGALSAPDAWRLFYRDNTSATLNHLMLNIPQMHLIQGVSDENWALFYGHEGLPYTVVLSDVGGGADPRLLVYANGKSQAPISTDLNGFGRGETFGRLHWPRSGWCYIQVKPAALRTGPTSYTLTVTGDWGANNGLATISGSTVKFASTRADSLALPKSVSGSLTAPLYTRSSLAYPDATFTGNSALAMEAGSSLATVLLVSAFGDPINTLKSPWVTRWHTLYPSNFAITRIGISPTVTPQNPIEISIEMRKESVVWNITDGETVWPNARMEDINASDNAAAVRVFRWSPAKQDWILFDACPQVITTSAGWLVKTRDASPDLSLASSAFYGAATVPLANTRAWTCYR